MLPQFHETNSFEFQIETIKTCIELGKALKGELYVEKLQWCKMIGCLIGSHFI